MAFIDGDNILKSGYTVSGSLSDAPLYSSGLSSRADIISGQLRSYAWTILLFEDMFMFLDEEDSNLIAAEKDDINIYKDGNIESGALNGQ